MQKNDSTIAIKYDAKSMVNIMPAPKSANIDAPDASPMAPETWRVAVKAELNRRNPSLGTTAATYVDNAGPRMFDATIIMQRRKMIEQINGQKFSTSR
jgi:hypothetical protein